VTLESIRLEGLKKITKDFRLAAKSAGIRTAYKPQPEIMVDI
jgi:hypothetical protein